MHDQHGREGAVPRWEPYLQRSAAVGPADRLRIVFQWQSLGQLAQCARMNGNTSASAAFANDVAYRMEPQRRVACRDASTPERGRCVTWVTQPAAFSRGRGAW